MARISRDHLYLWFEHNVNVDTKTLYLGHGGEGSDCDVNEVLAANVIKALHVLDRIHPDKPISIILNNAGGDDHHGLAIYDMIRMCTSQVIITVLGQAQSMAAWILQAADIRRMTTNSFIMIHHGEGTKDDLARETDRRCLAILLERIRKKNPTFSEARLDKMLLKDTNLWSEQALELGLIDEIIHS